MFKTVNIRTDVRKILNDLFKKHLEPHMVVYDVGCGDKPFKLDVKEHIGVDIGDSFYDTSHLDIVADAYDIPVEDKVADAIISSQVLEHLERPEDAVKEAHRLLKPKGLYFVSVPFLSPIHAAPYDFSRMTEYQLTKYMESNEFEVITLEKTGGFWYMLGTSLGLYLQPIDRGFLKKIKLSTALLWFIRWIFYLLHSLEGLILKLAKRDLDRIRGDWAVNYVILARKQ